jgi:Mrp family chromosome partitioning ATPase
LHDEALVPVTSVKNLHVLCAGAVPPNPQELISGTSFTYLMKTLPDRFRCIIISTAPALAFADAHIVVARARACLLVTRRHHTRLADVRRVQTELEPTHAVLLGGVMQA